MSSLFLEFDAPELGSVREPGVFLRLRSSPTAKEILAILEPLRNVSRPQAELPTLTRCLEAIRPQGRLMHVGTLTRDDVPDLRLHVTIPRTCVSRILCNLFSSDLPAEHSKLLLERGPDWVDLQLQVSNETVASVGVEISFGRQPPDDSRWEAWLRPLIREGFCDEAKVAAALHWSASGAHATRELSHIKATLSTSEQPKLKAYLGIWQTAEQA